jgi:HrpA-like RNA helicase
MSATISKDEFLLYISNFGGKGIQISPLVFNGTTPYQIRKHYRGNQQTLSLHDTSIVNTVHLLHKQKKMTVGEGNGILAFVTGRNDIKESRESLQKQKLKNGQGRKNCLH